MYQRVRIHLPHRQKLQGFRHFLTCWKLPLCISWVKKGFESIHDFSLGGLVPPLEVNATDHEGGGWVQVFQVKGGKLVKETDWFRAYPEVVTAAVAKAE